MASDKKQSRLFKEFPPILSQQWEKKIREDLKGADYERKLVWRTIDGMAIRPYYCLEDLSELAYLNTSPGQFPFTRGNKIKNNEWEIRQDIAVHSFSEANFKALSLLSKGITSICFVFNDQLPADDQQLEELLTGIDLRTVPIHFRVPGNDFSLLILLVRMIQRTGLNPALIRGSLNLDPFGHLFLTGNFFKDKEKDISEIKQAVEYGLSHIPFFRLIIVDAGIFHNAGASLIQELGYALATGAEYLAILTDLGLTVDQIAPRIVYHFPAGSEYFLEIAKLRAARLLWSMIIHSFGLKKKNPAFMYIHSSTSVRNQTLYDPYNNLLRGTTEAMSAILGGADSMTVTPFDKAADNPGEFSERLARNIQVILKEEAYFDKVIDPAAGSYYIEKLTDSIAEHAWTLFLETEKQGGILSLFAKEKIQDAINETARERFNRIANLKESLVGINKYPDSNELESEKNQCPGIRISPDHQAEQPSKLFKKNTMATELLAMPLKPIRIASEFEEIRLKTSASGKKPLVFLLTYGNPAMRRTRAVFASNFFSCAGFNVVDNPGFNIVLNGITEALKKSADIVVLCSSDAEYSDAAPAVLKKLKGRTIIVIAGYPKDIIKQLKTIGIEHFIHLNSNVPEELRKFQKLLNI